MLQEDPTKQFTSRGMDAIKPLFWNLWDNVEVQDEFVKVFIIQQSKEYLNANRPKKVEELLEMVVQNLFIDYTSQISDWRLVEI